MDDRVDDREDDKVDDNMTVETACESHKQKRDENQNHLFNK